MHLLRIVAVPLMPVSLMPVPMPVMIMPVSVPMRMPGIRTEVGQGMEEDVT